MNDVRGAAHAAMAGALTGFGLDGPIVVFGHFDADGLSAVAILVCAPPCQQGAELLVIGKGKSPWDAAIAARIAAMHPAGLIIVDLGTRPEPVLPGCPTLVIDHHVPSGHPQDAITISGNGLDPELTTALIAYWATTHSATNQISFD